MGAVSDFAAHPKMCNEIGQSERLGTLRAACDNGQSGSSINWEMERAMWCDALALALRRKFRKAE